MKEQLFIDKWHLVSDIEPPVLENVWFVDKDDNLCIGKYNDQVHAFGMADGFGIKIEDVIKWKYASEREVVGYPKDGDTVAVELKELKALALGMYTDRYIDANKGREHKAVILAPIYDFENAEGEVAIEWPFVLSWYRAPKIEELRPADIPLNKEECPECDCKEDPEHQHLITMDMIHDAAKEAEAEEVSDEDKKENLESAIVASKVENEEDSVYNNKEEDSMNEKMLRESQVEITDKDWARMANLIAKNNNGESVAAKITDANKAAARYVAGMKLLSPDEAFSDLDHLDSFFAPFYKKAVELDGSTQIIRQMQSVFNNTSAPEAYSGVTLGDKQKFDIKVNDKPSIRKKSLAQPGLIERAPRYDFSDDGNYFRGYVYKKLLPISALGSDGYIYYDIRIDYLGVPYAEYKSDSHLANEFNGVPKENFDADKFVQNCETLYQKYVAPRTEEIKAREVFSLEKEELKKAQRARFELNNKWHRSYRGWEKDYAERSFTMEDFRNSPDYANFLNRLEAEGLMADPTKKKVLELERKLKQADLIAYNQRKPQPNLPGFEGL